MITTQISQAVTALNQEQVIGFPTETVYGLAGNIFSEKAIRQIFAVKQRPLYNPLIVHIKGPEALAEVAAQVPDAAKKLAEAFWPGPLTLVLPKHSRIPDLITAGKPTVAIRMPDHPVALALLQELDFPLAAPSANPFSAISPTRAEHVEAYFGDTIPLVLDGGPCKAGIESTIVGFVEGKATIFRLGSLAQEEIEKIIGPVQLLNKKEQAPDAPGMLAKHYSPTTPTLLTNKVEELASQFKNKKIGLLLFQNELPDLPEAHQVVLSPTGDFKEAAARLYAAMHELDHLDLDLIIAQRLPDHDLGRSINDRLERAAQNP